MSTAAATAAPEPVTIGDRKYDASPLNLMDLGTLEGRVKAAMLDEAGAAADRTTLARGDRFISCALSKVVGITYQSQEMIDYLKTFNGSVAFLCLSLRQRHPDIEEASIGMLLKANPAQFSAAMDVVTRISGFGGKAEPAGNVPPGGVATTQ